MRLYGLRAVLLLKKHSNYIVGLAYSRPSSRPKFLFGVNEQSPCRSIAFHDGISVRGFSKSPHFCHSHVFAILIKRNSLGQHLCGAAHKI